MISCFRESINTSFYEQGFVKCDCKGYLSLCSHTVAISEKEGSLSLHVVNFQKKPGEKPIQDLLRVTRHLQKVLKEKVSRKEELYLVSGKPSTVPYELPLPIKAQLNVLL